MHLSGKAVWNMLPCLTSNAAHVPRRGSLCTLWPCGWMQYLRAATPPQRRNCSTSTGQHHIRILQSVFVEDLPHVDPGLSMYVSTLSSCSYLQLFTAKSCAHSKNDPCALLQAKSVKFFLQLRVYNFKWVVFQKAHILRYSFCDVFIWKSPTI